MEDSVSDAIASHDSRTDSRISRRRVLAGAGLIAAGTAGGVLVSTQPAVAVSVDDLAVSDSTFEAEAVDPRVDVHAAYQYELQEAPDELRLYLTVGGDPVDQATISTTEPAMDGTRALSGRVVESGAWSAGDFEVEPGEAVARDVEIGLVLRLRRSGAVVAEADAQDTAELAVSHPEEFTETVLVGGDSEIVDANSG